MWGSDVLGRQGLSKNTLRAMSGMMTAQSAKKDPLKWQQNTVSAGDGEEHLVDRKGGQEKSWQNG